MPQFGECPLPSPPPRGRERVTADSSVAGRLKKNTRNINGRNFSGSLYRKADGTNAASVFFQTTFEPTGRVCAARHARSRLEFQGKWRARACVPHTPYMRAAACLIPTVAPSSLPWERVRERATSRKACIGAVKVFGKDCRHSGNALSPTLPHGRGSGLRQIQMLQVV